MASDYDGSIKIDTEIDTKPAEQGLNSLNKKLINFAKGGLKAAAVAKAFQTTAKAIKETTEAYKVQAKAEKQLEIAAKNNPYLDGNSVKQLKDYASQLQSISTVGDETLLPLMAQLSTAGRTQAEIQSIMSAALDVSASGMMSLDQAVTQLNATYSGNVGLLGRQITGLKELTTEELKSGKAVEIVAGKFKGIAEETAKATGSSEQLKNAWGDLKEEIGAGFEKALSPMRSFFTGIISGWASAKKAAREYKELQEGIVKGTADATPENLELYRKQVIELQTQKNKLESEIRTNAKGMGYTEEEIKKELDGNSEFVRITNQLSDARENLKKKTDELKKAEEDRKKAESQNEDVLSDVDKRDALRKEYDETIKQAQKEIEIRRALGEDITEQAEAEELLNTAMDAYVKMFSDPAFAGNSGNYEHEVNARKQIAEWMEKSAKSMEDISNLDFSDVDDFINSLTDNGSTPISQQIEETINMLSREQRAWKDNAEVYEEITHRITQLEKLKTKALADEAELQKQKTKENLAEMMRNINSYFSQFSSIISSISNLTISNAQKETKAQNKELQNQYTSGLMSYEEYCEKKKEISRKQAEAEYKAKMWEWSASLLQATANIAQGVTSALALTPPYSFIQAALVSAAGAVQLASLTQSKPQRPKFATGGYVGGNSYTGDHVNARLNSGELVLNASQQANLWKMANTGTGGGTSISMPVSIENKNGSAVNAQLDTKGLKIIVDDMVNTSMMQGKYTQSMQISNNKSKGARYL